MNDKIEKEVEELKKRLLEVAQNESNEILAEACGDIIIMIYESNKQNINMRDFVIEVVKGLNININDKVGAMNWEDINK